MSKLREKYQVGTVDVFTIRNRNELRVVECLNDSIEKLGLANLSEELIQDAYAYALNQLPARYAQSGTIILRDPVRKTDVEQIVHDALHLVINNPKKGS